MLVTRDDLTRLRCDVDAVLMDAPHTLGAAINWADLYCYRAYWWTDDHGLDGVTVEITEADPSATALQEYVRREICKRGWIVEVRTCW